MRRGWEVEVFVRRKCLVKGLLGFVFIVVIVVGILGGFSLFRN